MTRTPNTCLTGRGTHRSAVPCPRIFSLRWPILFVLTLVLAILSSTSQGLEVKKKNPTNEILLEALGLKSQSRSGDFYEIRHILNKKDQRHHYFLVSGSVIDFAVVSELRPNIYKRFQSEIKKIFPKRAPSSLCGHGGLTLFWATSKQGKGKPTLIERNLCPSFNNQNSARRGANELFELFKKYAKAQW